MLRRPAPRRGCRRVAFARFGPHSRRRQPHLSCAGGRIRIASCERRVRPKSGATSDATPDLPRSLARIRRLLRLDHCTASSFMRLFDSARASRLSSAFRRPRGRAGPDGRASSRRSALDPACACCRLGLIGSSRPARIRIRGDAVAAALTARAHARGRTEHLATSSSLGSVPRPDFSGARSCGPTEATSAPRRRRRRAGRDRRGTPARRRRRCDSVR